MGEINSSLSLLTMWVYGASVKCFHCFTSAVSPQGLLFYIDLFCILISHGLIHFTFKTLSLKFFVNKSWSYDKLLKVTLLAFPLFCCKVLQAKPEHSRPVWAGHSEEGWLAGCEFLGRRLVLKSSLLRPGKEARWCWRGAKSPGSSGLGSAPASLLVFFSLLSGILCLFTGIR